MKLISYDDHKLGATDGDAVWDLTELSPAPPTGWPVVNDLAFIDAFASIRAEAERIVEEVPTTSLDRVRLQAPVQWPSKLIAYPANYFAHVAEMHTGNRADINGFFLKAASTICGPADQIVLPDLAGVAIHHECELAIIIGRGGRHIAIGEARQHIFGYSCLIDVTVRGTQERVMRKSFDTFCPLGPWIVTEDEVDAADALGLSLSVNGEVRQSANTRDLIVGIDEMVSLASSVMTLYPGDVIATGTPGGVGPIVPGDLLKIEIDEIGCMTIPAVGGGPIANRAFDAAREVEVNDA